LVTNIPDTAGHQMTIRVTTSPKVCFCTTCKKDNKRNMHSNKQKNVNKFHLCRSVASNSPHLSPLDYSVCGVMQQRVYWTPFRNVKLKKRLVEVWSRTLSTLLSMNGESICLPVFAQRADITNIFCKQLGNWSFG